MGNDPGNQIDPSGCISHVVPSTPYDIHTTGGGSGGGVSDGTDGGTYMVDGNQVSAEDANVAYRSSISEDMPGGGGGAAADQGAAPVCGGTEAPVTPDNPTGQSTTQVSSNSADPDGTNIVSAVITGVGNSLKKLDNALDRGDFLDQIFGPSSSMGQSWNSFSNSHMISENKYNGLMGDWSGTAGFYNFGLPTINATFGTLGTLTGVGALATGVNLGSMTAGEVIWNATSVTLDAYNTVAPGNQVTEHAATLMDMIEVINKHPNPASIINFAIQGLDNLYQK